MSLGVWGMFFLKMFLLFAGIYALIVLTPRLAAFIDKHRKNDGVQNAMPPERASEEKTEENSACKDDDKKYKSE